VYGRLTGTIVVGWCEPIHRTHRRHDLPRAMADSWRLQSVFFTLRPRQQGRVVSFRWGTDDSARFRGACNCNFPRSIACVSSREQRLSEAVWCRITFFLPCRIGGGGPVEPDPDVGNYKIGKRNADAGAVSVSDTGDATPSRPVTRKVHGGRRADLLRHVLLADSASESCYSRVAKTEPANPRAPTWSARKSKCRTPAT